MQFQKKAVITPDFKKYIRSGASGSIIKPSSFYGNSYCPTGCQDFTLIGNPGAGCTVDTRVSTIYRIGFMACSIDIPQPIDCNNIQDLFTSGDMVVSSPLANVVVNDPETEDVIIHECMPAQKRVVGRTIDFQDNIRIEVPADAGGSGNPANNFFDYDFWTDKKTKRVMLRYFLVFCNGDVIIPRDQDGNMLQAWFDIFLSYQKPSTNGAGWVEFKKGTLSFAGDPLNFQQPDFNLVTCGINV